MCEMCKCAYRDYVHVKTLYVCLIWVFDRNMQFGSLRPLCMWQRHQSVAFLRFHWKMHLENSSVLITLSLISYSRNRAINLMEPISGCLLLIVFVQITVRTDKSHECLHLSFQCSTLPACFGSIVISLLLAKQTKEDPIGFIYSTSVLSPPIL